MVVVGRRVAAMAAGLWLAAVLPLSAQAPTPPPDLLLINGKVVTLDASGSTAEAVAMSGPRISAVGRTADLRRLAGPGTRVVDLQGRTVVPGLIDSHIHAIRAALSFSTEVNWIGARSLREALGRLTTAAQTMPVGAWLIVAGGWDEDQFEERRRPTQAEIEAAAPGRPIYIQLGYSWAVLSNAGLRSLSITGDSDLPRGARLERDAGGMPTGAVAGDIASIVGLFDRLPRPSYQDQVRGTREFFRELNRLGITGVSDPGGNNLAPADYAALFEVWRAAGMTVRVRYTLNGQRPGQELEDFTTFAALLPMRFGDDMLRFIGLGERVTGGLYNNPRPTPAQVAEFTAVARWAARRGLGVTVHWGDDASVHHLLDIFEAIDRETPIAPLRWSIAHLNDASDATLRRMKALGVGWTVQDAMYFSGDAFARQNAAAARRAPPVVSASRIGVAVGAGTDAHRVASYNPFTALQWFLDGKTVSGRAIRGPEETPDRLSALRFYTLGSAWFSHEEQVRGSIEPGKLADMAVLSADYLTVPVDQVGRLEAVLTVTGGRVVYASGPFAGLDPAAPAATR